MLEGVSASLPDNVAEAIVYGGQAPDKHMMELRLPAEVRQAVAKYTVARRALAGLRAAETSEVQ